MKIYLEKYCINLIYNIRILLQKKNATNEKNEECGGKKNLSVMIYVLQGNSGLRWLTHLYFCGFQDAFQNRFSWKLLSSLVFTESLLCAGEYCWVLRLWQQT